MHHPAGGCAEDIQLLVVACSWSTVAGLMFFVAGHASPMARFALEHIDLNARRAPLAVKWSTLRANLVGPQRLSMELVAPHPIILAIIFVLALVAFYTRLGR